MLAGRSFKVECLSNSGIPGFTLVRDSLSLSGINQLFLGFGDPALLARGDDIGRVAVDRALQQHLLRMRKRENAVSIKPTESFCGYPPLHKGKLSRFIETILVELIESTLGAQPIFIVLAYLPGGVLTWRQ